MCVAQTSSFCIFKDLNLKKIVTLQSWTNCKNVQYLELGFWKCTRCPTIAMLWIGEVESATTVDDISMSKSITVNAAGDFEVLDIKIGSGLERFLSVYAKSQGCLFQDQQHVFNCL